MKHKLQEVLDSNPAWIRHYNRKYQLSAVHRMNEIIRERGIDEAALAEMTDWSEKYVRHLLTGRINLSLKHVAKFESALDVELFKLQ